MERAYHLHEDGRRQPATTRSLVAELSGGQILPANAAGRAGGGEPSVPLRRGLRAAATRPGADSRAAPAGCGTSLREVRLEPETRNSRGRTARLPRSGRSCGGSSERRPGGGSGPATLTTRWSPRRRQPHVDRGGASGLTDAAVIRAAEQWGSRGAAHPRPARSRARRAPAPRARSPAGSPAHTPELPKSTRGVPTKRLPYAASSPRGPPLHSASSPPVACPPHDGGATRELAEGSRVDTCDARRSEASCGTPTTATPDGWFPYDDLAITVPLALEAGWIGAIS